VTDCPRLIGWSSLDLAHHRSLTSFVVIAGTDCRFQNRRAASRRASYDERFVHPRDRDHHPEGPCGATGATIRTPSVVSQSNRSRRFALTGLRTALASMVRKRRAIRAPFSPWSRRHVCQHVCGVLLGQRHAADSPCGSPDVQRAMRWTDFCHLTSSYEYPRIVGSPCVRRLRVSTVEEIACCHDSAIRFGGPAQTCLLAHLTMAGVVFPSQCVHSLPLTSLSPPPRGA
jgi:hypothetical protein